ncbi:hypothetical protein MTR67_009254 [Solanum verrucosum]|uniref:DUF676 domain-containing protein n=1 Tax=Solanum verrucosum TaxID=315347 RepID=A0AAF0Q2V5_SOLVR|nr:hypothetical protein MTR67_009254 [Solanum verrucosum]
MASSATLLHHYSPRPSISSNSSSSSSSSASSSSSSSSFDQRRCFNWKFLCFSVSKRLEKLMITFLWDVAKGKRKYHLVNWERGMTPLKVVGVGKMNARYLKQIIVGKIVMEEKSVEGMKDKMDFCKVYRIPNQKYESTSVLAKPLMWDNTLKDDFLPLAGNKEVVAAEILEMTHTFVLEWINNICRSQSFRAHAMGTTEGSVMSPKVLMDTGDEPEHLLVLVHGILASPSDWTYVQAELRRRLGKNFLIYASSCNTFTKTFTGIDGAGKRLADEVRLVVKKKESLKKISFLAHSLGGLIARYALGELYSSDNCNEQSNDAVTSTSANLKPVGSLNIGLIAGLEPVNFITLATPHLGVRGKNQLPFLFGLPILEKLAAPIAPIFVGQTGSQLFLTDGKPTKPPLLLRMASDCDDGKFISALGAFKWRVLYANVSYDHMVGWRTSSIRRVTELVKLHYVKNVPPRLTLRCGPVVWAWDFHVGGLKFKTPCQRKQELCLLGRARRTGLA